MDSLHMQISEILPVTELAKSTRKGTDIYSYSFESEKENDKL